MLFRRAVATIRCGRLFATHAEVIVPKPAPPGYSSAAAGAGAASGGAARMVSEPAAASGALARIDCPKRRMAQRVAIVYN